MIAQRQIILLDDTNVADKTKDTYHSYLRSLFKWAKIKNQEEFIGLSDDALQQTLEGFADHLIKRVKNNEISPNTVPKLFKPYKLLLDVNYREHAVKWKPISIKYPPMEKRSGYKPWTTLQIEQFLGKCKNLREEATIHFQASTGSRVGVHDHPLLMKHMIKMKWDGLDYHCYAILVYAESDETIEEKDQRVINEENDHSDYSFFVFLTPEAAKALDDYHEFRRIHHNETFTGDTPIFVSFNSHGLADKGKYYQMSGNAFRKMFQDVVNKTPVKRIKKRNRYDTMLDHAFRKRFNTTLKIDNEINSNITEKLMQHKKGLDGAYLTPTRLECFKEFVKAVSELTISPQERQKIKIERQQLESQEKDKRIKELEEAKEEKTNLEKQFEEYKKETNLQIAAIQRRSMMPKVPINELEPAVKEIIKNMLAEKH